MKMGFLIRAVVLSILFVASPYVTSQESAASYPNQEYKPRSGYVPDSKTAVKIAEAVLVPVYGETQILSEQPFVAHLDGEVWTVSGTLRCPDGKGGTTTSCEGGTATVKLSKTDARVLFMIHYE